MQISKVSILLRSFASSEKFRPPSRLKIYIPGSSGGRAHPHPTDSNLSIAFRLSTEIDQSSGWLRSFGLGAAKKDAALLLQISRWSSLESRLPLAETIFIKPFEHLHPKLRFWCWCWCCCCCCRRKPWKPASPATIHFVKRFNISRRFVKTNPNLLGNLYQIL